MASFTRFDLTNQEYACLEAFLPPERSAQVGRPFRSHRQVINGILWIHRSGAPWRDLPDYYGPWTTVYDRFRRWCQEGFWARILNRLQARGRQLGCIDFEFAAVDGSVVRAHKAAAGSLRRLQGQPLTHEESLEKQALGFSRGGFSTKIHVFCEGEGKPISLTLTPGQAHENTQVDPLMVKVIVPAEMFGKIAIGTEGVVFPTGFDEHRSTAVVKLVDKVIDARSETFRVTLEMPNPDYRLPAAWLWG